MIRILPRDPSTAAPTPGTASGSPPTIVTTLPSPTSAISVVPASPIVTLIAPQKEKPAPVAICFRCGSPLEKHQIAMMVEGRFIEFDERNVGEITLFLCPECTKVAKEMVKEGIRGAVKRKEDADIP